MDKEPVNYFQMTVYVRNEKRKDNQHSMWQETKLYENQG